jgi:spore coat polysaccharide biosynthesis predicted glycosyltransferase SpsG
MQKWGGNNILFLSKEGLDKIAEKVNPFWKDAFFNLSELKQEKGELVIHNVSCLT